MHAQNSAESSRPLFLGIEAGGTKTTARLVDAQDETVFTWKGGPGNVQLLNDVQLRRLLQPLTTSIPWVDSIFAGFAGARQESDRERIRVVLRSFWPQARVGVGNDLDTAFASATPVWVKRKPIPQVLVLSGTGSCCVGRDLSGKQVRIGGWGHLLGDKASAYDIGLRALKAVVYYLDRDGDWTLLGQRILHRLQLNKPEDLIAWIQQAPKDQVAAIAQDVFAAKAGGDAIARDICEGAAHQLAKDAAACAGKVVVGKGRRPVQFLFTGGTLTRQPEFLKQVQRCIRELWPGAHCDTVIESGDTGAVKLARDLFQVSDLPGSLKPAKRGRSVKTVGLKSVELPEPTGLAPTEERNPRTMKLDQMSLSGAIRVILSEDATLPGVVLKESRHVEQAIRLMERALRLGGRVFYVGAGTSGRLGVLDASECPPTFRTPPHWVQGIIAGGYRALWEAVEGGEDDAESGGAALRFRGVTRKDVVIGIAASGRTPFVWGAMAEAKRLGARRVMVNCNPRLRYGAGCKPDVVISLGVGAEVLTGSTRLKSGTATKLVLNLLTTLTMVRLGKVVGNLMVDLNPSNVKLRGRAVRIVRELTGCDDARALAALEKSGWVVKKAIARVDRAAARAKSGR